MFCYKEYSKIIKKYLGTYKDFTEITNHNKKFTILRHDVEFSIERALIMAKIDANYKIRSSFFFQVYNSGYNLLSIKNKNIIKRILNLKHYIGLHLYVSHIKKNDFKKLKREIKKQVLIFNSCLDDKEKRCDRISIHRPPDWILKAKKNLFGNYINSYDKKYFEIIKNKINPIKIKYYSDSNHKWNYGHPLDLNNYQCFQLLIHPDEWSLNGGNEKDNFKELIKENEISFISNIDLEYKTFKRIKFFFKKNL
jgi:hypothetical protein